MKLSWFLYKALVCDEWYFEDLQPEDVPFEITQEELDNMDRDAFEVLCNKWWEEHNIEVMEDEITDYDLEKSYLTRRLVFRYDDKYYMFYYDYSYYWDDDDIIGEELDEVFPHEKTVIYYE